MESLKTWEKQGVGEKEKDIFQASFLGFFKSIKDFKSPDLVVTLRVCQQEAYNEIERLEKKNEELISKNKKPIYLKTKEGMLPLQEKANIITASFYEYFNYTEVLHLLYQNYKISTVCLDLSSSNLPKDPHFFTNTLFERKVKTTEKLTEIVRRNAISLIPSIKTMFNQESFKNVKKSFEKAFFIRSYKNVEGLAHSLLLNDFARKALLDLKEPTDDIVLSKRLEWISNVDLWPIVTKILLDVKLSAKEDF